jgi:ketopantoate reductase
MKGDFFFQMSLKRKMSCLCAFLLQNVWNLPFNGVSVAMGGITVDKIVLDPGLRQLADKIMDETIATANADLAKNGYGESFYLSDQDKRQMFDLSDNMGPCK